ncbi:MAG: HIT family protein [Candidatus Bathyarchaeota archaeon]|nr:HIT family protein [Candidatus Bathyarchaeota archaeon]
MDFITDNSCIFCRIVRKQAPVSVVYENEQVLAFMDIRPVSQGHTLIIPKEHYEDIFDTPDELLAVIHKVTKKIAVAVKAATKADGISIIQQNGAAAGQEIFHLHVHVIPRFEGQKMPRFVDLGVADRETLDETAAKIKQSLPRV